MADNQFRVDFRLGSGVEQDARGAQSLESFFFDRNGPGAERQVGEHEVAVVGSLEGAGEA